MMPRINGLFQTNSWVSLEIIETAVSGADSADPLLFTRALLRRLPFVALTFSVMKDPVILPVSRVTVDRSTIRAVLLSKELDPFNNVP